MPLFIESLQGLNHLDAAALLCNLGRTAKAQGERSDAYAYFERALQIFKEKLGEEHAHSQLIQRQLWELNREKNS